MSIVIYYPDAPADDLWMAQEGLNSLHEGLQAADLHWLVSLVIGRRAPETGADWGDRWLHGLASGFTGAGTDSGAKDIANLLTRAPGDMALSETQAWLARLDDAAVVHAPTSTTAVRLAETRRRGGASASMKIIWSPQGGGAPATRLARRLVTGGLEPAMRERLVAFQRWMDNRALDLADLILVESLADLESFAMFDAGKAAVSAARDKVRIQPAAVAELEMPADRAGVRRRLGLEASFVVALPEGGHDVQVRELKRDRASAPVALLTLKGGRAWIFETHGWSERGWISPPDALAACDAWVDRNDGEPGARRLAVQALALAKPGLSSDKALNVLEGVGAHAGEQDLSARLSDLIQTSPDELARRGKSNRREYLDRFAPPEAARRYIEVLSEIAGPLTPVSARSPRRRPPPKADLPRVSIILAAYNVDGYLDDCLASVSGQTYRELEIIVVNDGSTDGSAAVIHEWARRDPRFVVIDQLNCGLSAARNAGLDLATGDYICFVDGDDRVHTHYVERLLNRARSGNFDLVACAIEYELPDGGIRYHSTFHAHRAVERLAPEGAVDLSDKSVLAEFFPSAWNKIYRRRLFDDLRFPEGLYYEDHPVFFSIGLTLDQVGYVKDPLYRQRLERAGSITREAGERLFDIFPVLHQVFRIIDAGMEAPASLQMFKQVALRLLWERSNLITDDAFAERFAASAAELLHETGADAVQPRAVDDWIPRAASLRFQQSERSEMQCSVVLTYANDAKYIAPLLDAFQRQTLRQIEVIAVDNGSVDGASAVVAAKCASDPRFKRLVHQGALGGARNMGGAAAKGKYVLFAEGNDMLPPEALERLVSYAEDDDADVTVCAFEYFGSDWSHGHGGFHTPVPDLPERGGIARGPLPIAGRGLVADMLAFPCNKLFRRAFLEGHAIGFETEGFYEEHAFWCDVADAAPRLAYTSEVLYRVRDETGARRLWNGPGHAFDAVKALRSLARRLDRVEDQPLLAKLCVRLTWERLSFALTTPSVRAAFAKACRDIVNDLDPALLLSERDAYIPAEFVSETLDLAQRWPGQPAFV